MLSPKQIGTICFAIFSFVFSAPSFADPDIAPSASSADCKYAPLETYTGTSNLQADWQPNAIALHWYNGDTELTVPSASQSCVYDGTLTPPATIPTKTGYTFKGWRVRQPQCSFASSVCGLSRSVINSLEEVDAGYKSYDGTFDSKTTEYGLTSVGEWAATLSNGGMIRGISSCNNTTPNVWEEALHGMISISWEEATELLWGSCNGDGIKPNNTPFSSSVTGPNCWCKITSYTPSGGTACNVSTAAWVFMPWDISEESDCASLCAPNCTVLSSDPHIPEALFLGSGN